MSSRPDHLSHRTLFPGALLAILVAAGALFALAVVIAVGPDGPARLWLDGGGSTLNLQSRAGEHAGAAGGLTLAGSPVGLLTDAPTAGVKGAVTLAATPRTVRLRGATRVQRRSVRLPAAGRPTQPAPSGTKPTTLVSTPTATAPQPVATPAPGSTVVKTRGRPNTPESNPVAVRKQRVSAAGPGPAAVADPAPASTPAPQVAKRPVAPSAPQDAGVVLTRVPPPPTGSGG
jgi:hypothetical protein